MILNNLKARTLNIPRPTKYTQTKKKKKKKKKRPIFMVLYLSIQLRCHNKNKTKYLSNVGHTKLVTSCVEGLLNLMCTQLFPLPSGSKSLKRDTFYVKWQPETSDDE